MNNIKKQKLRNVIFCKSEHFSKDKNTISGRFIFVFDLRDIFKQFPECESKVLENFTSLNVNAFTNKLKYDIQCQATCKFPDQFNEKMGIKILQIKARRKATCQFCKILKFIQKDFARVNTIIDYYTFEFNKIISAQTNYLNKVNVNRDKTSKR